MATQTPEYAAFRTALDEKLIPLLNRLEHAYDYRKRARAKAKTPTSSVASARRDWLEFGHFDDCGPSYTAEYEDAVAKVEVWIPNKIASEKFYKRCGHEFMEAGGTPEQLAMITKLLVGCHHPK